MFFEKDLEWYASNRDLPEPSFCDVRIFQSWNQILPEVRRELAECDVAVVGSYFPLGIVAIEEVLASRAQVKAFYDIDTPITVAQLRQTGRTEYLQKEQIAGFDLYFSFTGGEILRELEKEFEVLCFGDGRHPLPARYSGTVGGNPPETDMDRVFLAIAPSRPTSFDNSIMVRGPNSKVGGIERILNCPFTILDVTKCLAS